MLHRTVCVECGHESDCMSYLGWTHPEDERFICCDCIMDPRTPGVEALKEELETIHQGEERLMAELKLNKKIKLDSEMFIHLSKLLRGRQITLDAFYVYILGMFLADKEGSFAEEDMGRAYKALMG